MIKIHDYAEGLPVEITTLNPKDTYPEGLLKRPRLVIKALNEGGCNCTLVDLIDVLRWVKENKPELLEE